MTCISSKSVHWCRLGTNRRIKQKKILKRHTKKPHRLGDMSRVRPDHPRCRSATWICLCGQTHGIVIISSFVEIRSGVSKPKGVEICPFPLLQLLAFTTAGSTVPATMTCFHTKVCLFGVALKYTSFWRLNPQNPYFWGVDRHFQA